jgi:phosphoribosylformylglycinamidine synthase PurS subunit
MKARVYVSLKKTVLDPQGQAVRNALVGLGHSKIQDVRQGKVFEITMEPGEDIDAIAREVLTNPVIEEFEIEYL